MKKLIALSVLTLLSLNVFCQTFPGVEFHRTVLIAPNEYATIVFRDNGKGTDFIGTNPGYYILTDHEVIYASPFDGAPPLYVSRYLFDLDDEIEFSYTGGAPYYSWEIANNNGEIPNQGTTSVYRAFL